MFWGSFDINKDFFDYFVGICSCIGAVAVPILVWYFGASRTEAIKERENHIALLNYLTIAINEFNNYYIALLNAFNIKENDINSYFAKSEENKKKVFTILRQIPYSLELNYVDYNFTSDGNPQILKLLFKYRHYIDALLPNIDNFNNKLIELKDLSDGELRIKLQYDFLDTKIPDTKLIIYLILYILKCLSDEIQRYNKEFMQSDLLYITIPENTKSIFEDAETAIDNKFSVTNPEWRSEFIFNPATRRKPVSKWTKIKNIFINPK